MRSTLLTPKAAIRSFSSAGSRELDEGVTMSSLSEHLGEAGVQIIFGSNANCNDIREAAQDLD